MNWNAIKTIILGSGLLTMAGPAIINAVLKAAGCTGDDPLTAAVEVSLCTGGSLIAIPAGLQTIVGGLVITAAIAGTAWFKGGTWKQNLFYKSVPQVNYFEAKPGVVTEEQVNSNSPR